MVHHVKCQGTDDEGNDVLLHIELARARHAERARRGERRVDGGEEGDGDHEANNLRGGRAKHGVEGEHQKIRREDARGGVRVEKKGRGEKDGLDELPQRVGQVRELVCNAVFGGMLQALHLDIISNVLGRCSRPLGKPSFLAYLAFLHRRRRNGSKRGLRRAQTRSRGGVHVLLVENGGIKKNTEKTHY